MASNPLKVNHGEETLLRWVSLLRQGLPHLCHPYVILEGDCTEYEVDFAWPDLKIAIEVDGQVHAIKGKRAADARKQNDLTLLGWKVFRFTVEQVTDQPDYCMQVLHQAVGLKYIKKARVSLK